MQDDVLQHILDQLYLMIFMGRCYLFAVTFDIGEVACRSSVKVCLHYCMNNAARTKKILLCMHLP